MKRFACLLISSLALPAWAGPGDIPVENWYVGAGANFAYDAFEEIARGVDVDSTNGWDLLVGYRADPHWALEAQAQFLQPFDLDGNGDGSVENNSYTLAGKIYPMDGPMQPFLSAGFGLLNSRAHGRFGGVHFRDTDTEWSGVFGGGIDVPLHPDWALEGVVRYFLPTGELNEFDFWTVGANVQYRFR